MNANIFITVSVKCSGMRLWYKTTPCKCADIIKGQVEARVTGESSFLRFDQNLEKWLRHEGWTFQDGDETKFFCRKCSEDKQKPKD